MIFRLKALTFSLLCGFAILGAIFTASSAYALFDGVDEEAIGRETDKKIVHLFGLYDSPKLQGYVRRVGKRILLRLSEPEYEYHFKLLDNEMINAFALPGGYVYVTRGLLAVLDSEAALAGVIGHEIGHVIGHHGTKQAKKSMEALLLTLAGLAASKDARENAAAWLTLTTSLSQQILSGYGRDMEMESDEVGMLNAYQAGYDPNGIVQFLKGLRSLERLEGRVYHGFLATHPDTITRIIDAEGKAELLKGRGKPVKKFRDRYLDMIDGLRYGKPKWRGKTLPPYKIVIHTVKKGETYRSIAASITGDASMALKIATINSMDHNTPLTPGYRIKVLVPVKSITKKLMDKKKEKKNEIGAGAGH